MSLTFVTSYAFAGGDWTTGDTVAQGGVVTFQVLDWAQTRWFIKHPMKPGCPPQSTCPSLERHETDVTGFLGESPSVGRANNFIAASIIAHGAISYWLPHGWLRDGWQYIWIGIEGDATHRNKMAGVKFSF